MTGIAFLVGGIDCLDNDITALAVTSFIVGITNILACLFVLRHPFTIKVLLLFINAAFAFVTSYTFFAAGKDKIQYAWAAIGLISLIAVAVAYVKRSRARMQHEADQIKQA